MKNALTEIDEILAMAEGDVKAFNLLYQRYHKPVFANILKLVDNRELATEVLQDVFLALWQNRYKIKVDRPVGGWLFVVSYNKSLNILRSRLKESLAYVADYPEGLCVEDDTAIEEEIFATQMQILEEAVDELPRRKREVFKMCRYEGRSREDVADFLGLSPQSVNDYLKQSNKSIREYIARQYPAYVERTLVLTFFLMNL
ncbi:RNA polymerase sigma factor [Sphingobacterium sp. SYP-B4668]|uniref:RNA polymerase sigma factor n=1 Tax=Sphingobacterium sp. SYP-B4668 TaxID=2996035 RepID=UPI0005327620|nr:sigma-70 family RNA polymerase sigma factor [Sphingobacterium sp. SYP-B4668]